MTLATTRTALTEWTLALVTADPDTPAEHAERLTAGIAAQVPGSVLGALNSLGWAADVTVDGHEPAVQWAARSTWVYRTTVPRTGDGSRARLVLDGVDTFATVRVDGRQVLATDDMFHAWTVDLGTDDAPGAWDVEVEIAPAEPVARQNQEIRPLPRADMYEIPFNQVRKMACSFGWDWGPTTITAGLYREARIERTRAARFSAVRLDTTWDGGAVLRGTVEVEGEADRVVVTVDPIDGSGTLLQYVAALDSGTELELTVPGAQRWDVVGRGAQPRYDVTLTLLDRAGAPLDRAVRRMGFRAIGLVQETDAEGVSCEIHVNGSRVWARGFNWIPADVLPERVTRAHMRTLIEEAVATGANMLRVWGGGIVESADFYDICDELGVLVWQDFSFACAAYAEDDAAAAAVAREVADAVARVGHHPSLALWCGCNENLWGWEDWGWKDQLGEDGAWGARLYHDVIPAALRRLDPHRPYIPGSPFSPDADRHPNDQTQGTTHHWDTWNQLDYVHFESKRSRFASEFGWQAPASWGTLVAGIGHQPADGADPELQRLQKHPEGKAALERAIADHVPHLPKDGRGWYLSTQLVQARAIRAAIGRFRSLHDTCSGALWWQLDDCWPALSWAVLDVNARRKLGWHAAAETMAARAVIITADGSVTGLTLVNDLPEAWEVTGSVRVVDESGTVLHWESLALTVPADGHAVVEPAEVPTGAAAVVVDASGIRGTRWIVPDLQLSHPEACVTVEDVTVEGATATVTVRARTLVRDLVLLAETHPAMADARIEGQLRLLLPGETTTFTVESSGVGEVAGDTWAELLAAGTALLVA